MSRCVMLRSWQEAAVVPAFVAFLVHSILQAMTLAKASPTEWQ